MEDLSNRIYLGSAGGNGGQDTHSECFNDLPRWGGIGGAGGGIIVVYANDIVLNESGIIDSQGNRGDGSIKLGRGGGGGSGGSIYLNATNDLIFHGYVHHRYWIRERSE